MKKFRYDQMKGGWFVGNFEPSVFKTKNFEVGYLKHKKGDMWDKHYHKHATEINLIVRGRVKVNDEIYSKGDIFIIEPNETIDPLFLEDTEVVVVKAPSILNDKYIIER
jgi:quercetin dioxygenase-like cupin family protein